MHVAVDALQLVVEEVRPGAAGLEHVAHDVAALPHDVGDGEAEPWVVEQA